MSNILDISSQHLPVHSEKTIIQREEDKEMKEWYRQQINQMIMHINDELKNLYHHQKSHQEGRLIVFLL